MRCPYDEPTETDCNECQQFCEDAIEEKHNRESLRADERNDERKINEQ